MKRRILVVAVSLLGLAGAFVSCENLRIEIYGYSRMIGTDQVEGVGTVVYIGIEGGFYGIIAGKTGHWDPINLPAAYMKDGLKIKFEAKLRTDLRNTHMWGTIVEILSISKL